MFIHGMSTGERMLWEPKRKEKECRRPAPLMWALLKEVGKVKAKHVTTADCQGILPRSVASLREEERKEKEAREVMEEKEDTRAKEKGRAKEKERVIRGVAGIVGRRATNQQSVGM